MTHIYRLKATWVRLHGPQPQAALSSKWHRRWDKLSTPADRIRLRGEEPPLLPYIGVYLADLTFVEGRPPLTSASSATLVEGINFSRMRMLKQVITELLHWQQFPYKFEPIPELIHYLNSEPPDQIPRVYQLSLELEPHT